MPDVSGGLDIATLGLQLDGRDFVATSRSAASTLDDVGQAAARVERSTQGLERATRTATSATRDQLSAEERRAAKLRINAEEEKRYSEQVRREAAQRASVERQQAGEVARARVEGFERSFREAQARIKEAEARGFLSPQEARAAGENAAREFNSGVLSTLDQARTSGLSQFSDDYTQIAGSLKNVNEAGRAAGVGMHRLNNSLIVLTRQAAGAHPVVGQLVDVVGTFAIGTAKMVPILAGLAAIAFAFREITKDSREAREATRNAIDELTRAADQRALGGTGLVEAQVERAVEEQARLAKELEDAQQALRRRRERGASEATIEAAQQRVAGIREEYMAAIRAEEEGGKQLEEANRQAWGRVLSLREEVAREREAASKEEIDRQTARWAAEVAAANAVPRVLVDTIGEREMALRISAIFDAAGERALEEAARLNEDIAITLFDLEPHTKVLEESAAEIPETVDRFVQAAAQNMHQTLSQGFEGVFTDGLDGFESFADSILDIFVGLAADIAALRIADGLGLDDVLSSGKLTRTQSGVAAGAIGIGAGLGTGSGLGGALGGAIGGAAVGGPFGAVLGGVTGLVSGLWGQSKRAEEAAEQMRRAQQAFSSELTDFIRALELEGAPPLERALERIRQDFNDWIDNFETAFGFEDDPFGNLSSFDGLEDFIRSMELYRDVTSRSAEANAEWNRIIAAGVQAIQAAERAERERIAAVRLGVSEDIRQREANLVGGQEGERVRLQIDYERQIREAEKLQEAGDITADMFNRLSRVLGLELVQALQDAEAAAGQAAAALTDDLFSRGLRALGLGAEADSVDFRSRQRQERFDLRGESGDIQDLLRFVQGIEAENFERRQAINGQIDAIESAAEAQIERMDQQIRLAEDQLRVVAEQLQEQRTTVRELSQAVDALDRFGRELRSGPSSFLSPVARLQAARGEFDAVRSLALGGDASAARELPGISSNFLDALREVFGSTLPFQQGRDDVLATVETLEDRFGRQLSVEEQMLAELERQNEALQAQIDALREAREQARADAQRQIDQLRDQAAAEAARSAEQIETLRAQLEELRSQTNVARDNLIKTDQPPGPDDLTRSAMEQALANQIGGKLDASNGLLGAIRSEVVAAMNENTAETRRGWQEVAAAVGGGSF